jgi:hypothetical protein
MEEHREALGRYIDAGKGISRSQGGADLLLVLMKMFRNQQLTLCHPTTMITSDNL